MLSLHLARPPNRADRSVPVGDVVKAYKHQVDVFIKLEAVVNTVLFIRAEIPVESVAIVIV